MALLGALASGAIKPPTPPLAVTYDDTPSAVPGLTPVAAESLPALRLPGARGGPAGEYGWEGMPGFTKERVCTESSGAAPPPPAKRP